MTQRTAAQQAATGKALEGRYKDLPMRRLGLGPWRILPECPSVSTHNTVNAARGVGRDGLKCICPHALDVLTDYRRAEKERRAEAGGRAARKESTSLSRHVPPTAELLAVTLPPRPDFRNAECRRTPENMLTADRAFGTTAGAQRAAKRLCARCPVSVLCGANVLQNEPESGDWGGVWGGMSAADRTRIGKTEAYQQFHRAKREAAA